MSEHAPSTATGSAGGRTGALARAARARTEELRGELLDLSHAVHAEPELRFAEHAASAR